MISCIIVDDEPLAQEILEGHIKLHGGLALMAKCSNAVAAFDVLNTQAIDLMFLDIRMPGISGVDLVKALKNPPKVIFTTAYPEHAINGFELDAIDYLLKPVTYEKYERSLQKLFRVIPQEETQEKDHTYFKVSWKLIKIMHADLLFAQSIKDYILLQTSTGRFITHMTMKFLDKLLPASTFIRVHRSYIVNKNHISMIEKGALKVGDQFIPIGELFRPNLKLTNMT